MGDAKYIFFTRVVLVFVFLVILAGGVVRTTQSGMGCPDWPHCFGLWMPPLNAAGLPPDYEKYLSMQTIDKVYNAAHAWIEWINRMLTAVLGFLILIHVAWSYKKYFGKRRVIFWLSLLLLLVTAFEAWLGKTVVESNLAVLKITLHMLMALVLAMLPVIILHKLRKEGKIEDNSLKWLSLAAIIVVLVQIILGTDVREQVDEVSKSLDYVQREVWLGKLSYIFDVHRAFSLVAALMCILLFWRSLSHAAIQKTGIAILVIMFATMSLGFVMASYNIPAFAQPLHLLFSAVLFIILFSLRLRVE